MRWAVLVLLVTIRTVCVCVPVCAIHCCCLSAVFHAPYSPSGFFFFFSFFILHWPFWECVRFGIRNSNCILLITSSSVHCSTLRSINISLLCHLALFSLMVAGGGC